LRDGFYRFADLDPPPSALVVPYAKPLTLSVGEGTIVGQPPCDALARLGASAALHTLGCACGPLDDWCCH
jgi:hypothetical protein